MKKILIILFTSFLFISCGTDKPPRLLKGSVADKRTALVYTVTEYTMNGKLYRDIDREDKYYLTLDPAILIEGNKYKSQATKKKIEIVVSKTWYEKYQIGDEIDFN